MGMGRFNANKQYRQQNPMGNASAIVQLLNSRSRELGNIPKSLNEFGQTQTRQGLADLIGSGSLNNKTPLEQQSLIQSLTGGRTLGEQGNATISDLLKASSSEQNNEWKEDAATTLFGRQNSQIAQRQANALARDRAKDSYSPLGTNENKAKSAYFELMSKTKDPVERSRIAQEAFFNGVLSRKDIMNMDDLGLSQGLSGGQSKLRSEGIPSALKTMLSASELNGLKRGKNSGQIRLVDVNKGKSVNGRPLPPKYEMRSRSGQPINPSDLLKF